jgi:hypothetical protein
MKKTLQRKGKAMTDRELLELAAKAAGVDGNYFHSDNPIHCGIYQARGEYYWNPLVSDSEALRLAVKLGMRGIFEIGVSIQSNKAYAYNGDDAVREVLNDGDPLAATRRAIVRAAAQMPPKEPQ